MKCKWCKDTGKLKLLYSEVECNECEINKTKVLDVNGDIYPDLGSITLELPDGYPWLNSWIKPQWKFYDQSGNEISWNDNGTFTFDFSV